MGIRMDLWGRRLGVVVALAAVFTVSACSTGSAPMTEEGSDMVENDAGSVVRTDSGPVRGTAHEEYRSFQGIPYAAPPVGELRWRSPQSVQAWSEPRDATKPGSPCPQKAQSFADVDSVDEDCLSLNVTTPHSAEPKQLKPVMVWIHGGGGANGAGHFFDARRLAAEEDVVVVTVNYRLGVFGAFGHPGLEGSGTFGLEDQQAALRWVQRNVEAFGGDPDNVTLFGESYGALSISAQLASPASEGLFHQAIIQSGLAMIDYPAGTLVPGVEALPSMWASSSEAEALGSHVASRLGCEDPESALECLREAPVEELLPHSSLFTRFAFGNDTLPEDPTRAFEEGRFHRVAVISGATRDEARLFVAQFFDLAGQTVTSQSYPGLLKEAFGREAGRVEDRYPLSDYQSPSLAWSAVITDRVWVRATLEQNRLLAEHTPTYAYEFADRDAPPIVPFPPDFPPDAHHGSEMVYQFDLMGTAADLSPDQQRLAEQMNRYWANFAHTGDPNGPDLPRWAPFDNASSEPYVQSLAPGTDGIRPVDYAAEHQLDFWSDR